MAVFGSLDLLRYASTWDNKATHVLLDAAEDLIAESQEDGSAGGAFEVVPGSPVSEGKEAKVADAVDVNALKERRKSRALAAVGSPVEGVRALKEGESQSHGASPLPPTPPTARRRSSETARDAPRAASTPDAAGQAVAATPTAAPPPPSSSNTAAAEGDADEAVAESDEVVTFEEFSTGGEVRVYLEDGGAAGGKVMKISVNGWGTVVEGQLVYVGSLLMLSNGSKLTIPAHRKKSVIRNVTRLGNMAGVEVVDGAGQAMAGTTTLSHEEQLALQKEYIKKHRVHLLLGDALDSCLRDLPPDPYYYIASTLMRYSATRGTTTRPAWGTPSGTPSQATLETRATSLECEVRRLQQQLEHARAEHALEKEVFALREQVTRLTPTPLTTPGVSTLSPALVPMRPTSAPPRREGGRPNPAGYV